MLPRCLLRSIVLCLAVLPLHAQVAVKTTVCELLADPAKWNHQLVEVAGFASHGFEDSGFFEPSCHGRYGGLWMEYGGKRATGTMSTASTLQRERAEPAVIEGIAVPLVEDKAFQAFDNLLQRRRGGIARATVIGRFFAGRENLYGRKGFSGFGHMGCCSLFVIQQIVAVDTTVRDDLSYDDESLQPNAKCYRGLLPIDTTSDTLAAQRLAETGERAFAMDEPERVVQEEVVAHTPGARINDVRTKRLVSENGRMAFEARVAGRKDVYTVTLARPYWLSFYAKDPRKVAWVVIGEWITCDARLPSPGGTVETMR